MIKDFKTQYVGRNPTNVVVIAPLTVVKRLMDKHFIHLERLFRVWRGLIQRILPQNDG